MQVAEALGRPFHMAARVSSEYALIGFIDAGGTYHRTAFREAYEHGGVFLFDEIDASDADALTAFNAALANGHAVFPDTMVKRHPDFAAIAAGNTFGRGADRQYVGRNQLDAATLDRFQVFEIDYDNQLELAIAGNDEWARYVQKVRAAIDKEKVRHVVSPRASIIGARFLAAGMARKQVEECCIWKGLDEAQRARINARMGG
jgi:MoxR-like ATPase